MPDEVVTGRGPTVPPPLRPGDTVAVVSPSSPVLPGTLEAGIAELESWGLRVRVQPHVRAAHGHLAGTDAQRIADLDAAFADPQVRAVWASRGGYGLTRITDRLDWPALARDPKWLVGHSDTTALLQAAWKRLRLVGLHGQFVGRLSRQSEAGRDLLRDLLFGRRTSIHLDRGPDVTVLAGGRATGPLVGGNLAVTAAQAGTPDALDAAGAILLLEDVNEAPYAVDRMLDQLDRSGAFADIRGVVYGAFVRCDPPADRPSATVPEVIAERFAARGIPVAGGWPLGHTDGQIPTLHGGQASLDAEAATLTVATHPGL